MEVSTNQEISYSLRLTPTEARKLYHLFNNIAHCGDDSMLAREKIMCRDLAHCLRDEVLKSEGTTL